MRPCLALMAVLLAGAEGPPSTSPSAGRPAEGVGVVRRAFIPSDRSVHGEVRLLHHEGITRLQTVLCSPALVRGVKGIEKVERRSWPAGTPGHADSLAFVHALGEATDRALAEFADRSDGSDARRKLLIELVLDGEDAFFAFHGIDVDTSSGRIDITASRPFAQHRASVAYVSRSMRLQAGKAFGMEGQELEDLLTVD